MKKKLAIFSIAVIVLLIAFQVAPFIQAYRWTHQVDQVSNELKKYTQDIQGIQGIISVINNRDTRDSLESLTKELARLSEQDKILIQEPEVKFFLQSSHINQDITVHSNCFLAPFSPPSQTETIQWINQFDPVDLKSKLEARFKYESEYEGQFHHGNIAVILSQAAHYLHSKHFFNLKLYYQDRYYAYRNNFSTKEEENKTIDPLAIKFLNENSYYLADRAYFFSTLIPMIEQRRDEVWSEKLFQGFKKMISEVGICEDENKFQIELKDLIQSNVCYTKSTQWKGPYVSFDLVEIIKTGTPFAWDTEVQKKEEGLTYKFSYESDRSSFKKDFELFTPFQKAESQSETAK